MHLLPLLLSITLLVCLFWGITVPVIWADATPGIALTPEPITPEATMTTSPINDSNQPVINQISLDDKHKIQKEFLEYLMTKYTQNQTFTQIHQFMTENFPKYKNAPEPDQIIRDTLKRVQNVYEIIKPFLGNRTNKDLYIPEQFKKNTLKKAWLKGLCYWILGINDQHKIMIAYFYLPGNEVTKHEFAMDLVRYSFPEVPEQPENAEWFQNMGTVLTDLGVVFFDVNKFLPQDNNK